MPLLPPGLTVSLTAKGPDAAITDDARDLYAEALDLLLRKHRDYGPHNIGRSPGGPLNGLRVRMHDKLARLNHLLDSGATPEHESLEDTLLDLANYALIGVLVLRDQWPSK